MTHEKNKKHKINITLDIASRAHLPIYKYIHSKEGKISRHVLLS